MKYGLIGERLGHSFSKTVHEMLGYYEYELCEIKPNNLDLFMKEKKFSGINVTIPYKQDVIPYLDEIDDMAREIGAVNTVVNRGGKLYGYNTDYYGMKMLFTKAEIDPRGKKAAILGSGGTSKTAYAVLKSLGASEIIKVSRSSNGGAVSYDVLKEHHRDTEIIVNTTPLGMFPNISGCAIDVSNFERLIGVIDAVYNPINSTLVQSAREKKINAEGGLYMLICQAVKASELFLDKKLDLGVAEEIFDVIKKEKENLILVGMPACGKSTVGRILAERLSRKFVDTDDLITEKIGMEIKDYFKLYGEDEFRKVEEEVIRSLATENSLVIATGGGAVTRKSNITSLRYNGKIFFIDRPLDKLMPTESRPLSSDRASIEKRYNERYDIYCGCCDVHINADCEIMAVADKILESF